MLLILCRQHLDSRSELCIDLFIGQCLSKLLSFEYDVQLIHDPHVVVSWIREGWQLEPNPLEIINGFRSRPLIDEVPFDDEHQLVEGAEDLRAWLMDRANHRSPGLGETSQ